MKGIRGLLEKDFRLFFRQGGNLFCVLAFVALFFTLTEKKTATFIAIYIPSVIAVYAGNTISYDENNHGYIYLFSLPVNRKIYFFLYYDSVWMVYWSNLCRNHCSHKARRSV